METSVHGGHNLSTVHGRPGKRRRSETIWHEDPDAHFFKTFYSPTNPYWDTNPYNHLRGDGSGRHCLVPCIDPEGNTSDEDMNEEDKE